MKPFTKVTIKDLDELGDWRKMMLDAYREGASDQEVARTLSDARREVTGSDLPHAGGFGHSTFERMTKEEPEFREVVHHGRKLAEAFWLETYRNSALGKIKGNVPLLIFLAKNRLGWSDRQEVDHKGNEKPTFVVVQGKDTTSIEAPKPKAKEARKPH